MKQTLANDGGGPGKKYPLMMAKLRNKMHIMVADLINKSNGSRGRGNFVLPNCVISGVCVRGMVCIVMDQLPDDLQSKTSRRAATPAMVWSK